MIEIVIAVNKCIVFAIAVGAIWVLQTLMTDDRWRGAFPIFDNYLLRAFLTLIAAGFGVDFFSVYIPSWSEVAMNTGIAGLLWVFQRQFRQHSGEHPILKWRRKKLNHQ